MPLESRQHLGFAEEHLAETGGPRPAAPDGETGRRAPVRTVSSWESPGDGLSLRRRLPREVELSWDSSGAYFAFLTRSLRFFATVNFTTVLAGILIASPV